MKNTLRHVINLLLWILLMLLVVMGLVFNGLFWLNKWLRDLCDKGCDIVRKSFVRKEVSE